MIEVIVTNTENDKYVAYSFDVNDFKNFNDLREVVKGRAFNAFSAVCPEPGQRETEKMLKKFGLEVQSSI